MSIKNRFKIFFILLSGILLFLTISFSCSQKVEQRKCKNVIVIKGLFEIYDNNTCAIVVNPESKSRISYNLLNIDFFTFLKLKKYNKKMVKAKVCVIKEHSYWNRDVYLIEIKKIK